MGGHVKWNWTHTLYILPNKLILYIKDLNIKKVKL